MRAGIIGTGAIAAKRALAYRNLGFPVAACTNTTAVQARHEGTEAKEKGGVISGWARVAPGAAAMLAAAVLAGPGRAQQRDGAHSAERAGSGLTLTSPLDYQVFQRQTRLRGSIAVRGHAESGADEVDARVVGESLNGPLAGKWQRIAVHRSTGDFDQKLATTAGGFYAVEVRLRQGQREVDSVAIPHVGVGEVFLVAGQSNSTNYGEVPQKPQTGMVTTFNGETWRLANDPQPGVQDNSKKGSFLPAFGDALYRRYGVPVGVASVGRGSSSVRHWLPKGTPVEVMPVMKTYIVSEPDGTLTSDGTLFNGMMARMQQLGVHGFRAVLWHQGESDGHQPPANEIAPETYRRMIEQVIAASRKQAGWNVPWFVAEATYHTYQDTGDPPLREAQRSLWRSGIALKGPDTDTLTAAFRQNNGKGVHMNDAGLKAHGLLWAERVEIYLDPLLYGTTGR